MEKATTPRRNADIIEHVIRLSAHHPVIEHRTIFIFLKDRHPREKARQRRLWSAINDHARGHHLTWKSSHVTNPFPLPAIYASAGDPILWLYLRFHHFNIIFNLNLLASFSRDGFRFLVSGDYPLCHLQRKLLLTALCVSLQNFCACIW